jgi:hypothetical protein
MTKRMLTAFIGCLSLAACSKRPVETAIESPVDKKVIFTIYAAKDYSAPAYDNTTASLHLNVSAVSTKTGVSTPVWDTAYGVKDIRSFPQADQKWQVEKVFSLIQSIEKLTVAFAIDYDNNGVKQSSAGFETIPAQTHTFLQEVRL